MATITTVHRIQFLKLFGVFALIGILQKVAVPLLHANTLNGQVLGYGNLILFLATSLSMYFLFRSLGEKNAHSLLRNVYLGILLKLMICIIAAAAYILSARKQVNKPALIGCALFYAVYTALELYLVLKVNKQQSHAADGSPY